MTAEYFTADIPGKRTSLSISAKALERLKQEVGKFRSVGGSSGLLLGRKDPDPNNNESLTVTDCFPVATSENVQGPRVNPELLTRARALWKEGPSRTMYAVGRYQVTSAGSTRSTLAVRVQEFAPRDLYVQLNVQGSGGLASFYVIENDRPLEDEPDFTVPFDSLAANATKSSDGGVPTLPPSSEAVHRSDETRLEAPRPLSRKFEWFGVRAAWITVVLLAGIAGMILLGYGTVAVFKSVRISPSGAMDQTGSRDFATDKKQASLDEVSHSGNMKPPRGRSRQLDPRGISATPLSANTATILRLPAAQIGDRQNRTISGVKPSVKEEPVPLLTQPAAGALNRVRADRRTIEGAVPSALQTSARAPATIEKTVPEKAARIEPSKVASRPATTNDTESSGSQEGLVREGSSDHRILPRYVKPQPLQKPMPLLGSALYSRYAAGGVDVSVAVHIDATGHVTDARLKDVRHKISSSLQNPPILENAALTVAQRWTFEPARLYGKAIESDYNIIFRFSDTGR